MLGRSYSFDSGHQLYEQASKSNFHSPMVRSRKNSVDIRDGNEPWGWFEDVEAFSSGIRACKDGNDIPSKEKMKYTLSAEDLKMDIRFPLCQPLHKALSLPPPASEPPIYILESNLETQQLWYLTAGKRPKQPRQEREYFEQQWQKNFEASKVHYDEPIDTIAAPSLSPYNSEHQTVENNNPPPQIGLSKRSRTKIDDNTHSSEFNGEVIFKGISPFSHSVSKSFNDYHVSFMTVHIPCYRIFRSYATKTLRAEFLVIISLGSPTPVTFGVWRRHSDFDKLVKRLQALNLRSGEDKIFKNSLLSWDCVLQRKRWFQCLEKEYLTLKTFLLERFMHDLLFESPSPNIISSFMGFREGH